MERMRILRVNIGFVIFFSLLRPDIKIRGEDVTGLDRADYLSYV